VAIPDLGGGNELLNYSVLEQYPSMSSSWAQQAEGYVIRTTDSQAV
jgi:hypothetical protein